MKRDYDLLESDKAIILRHLKEQCEATCEQCGVHSEEAAEAKAFYEKVSSKPLEECRGDIFNFYDELADAVKGHVNECYGSNLSLVEMIQKFIKLEDS